MLKIKDAIGVEHEVNTLPPTGQSDAAGSLPVVLTAAQLSAIVTAIGALAPLLDGLEAQLGGTLKVGADALPLPAGAATSANIAAVKAAVDALAPLLDGVEGLLAGVDGPLALVPAGAANGAALVKPAGATGVVIYLGAEDSVTYTVAAAQPGAAPAATITVSGAAFALWPEALGPLSNLFITARTGTPRYRFV